MRLALSKDGETLFGSGLRVCARCGQDAIAEAIRHAPGCPVAPDDSVPAPATRGSDPRMYVWTARGIEREMDVDQRRERREPQRPFRWWE